MFDQARTGKKRGSLPLALSLALNLFLVGWAVTQHFGESQFAKPEPAPEVVAEAIAAALPAQDGDLVRRAFDAKRQQLQDARQRYLAAFDRLRRIISAETLDQRAFQDALVDLRAARQAERQIFGETMADVISHMSLQGRQTFVATHMGGRP